MTATVRSRSNEVKAKPPIEVIEKQAKKVF